MAMNTRAKTPEAPSLQQGAHPRPPVEADPRIGDAVEKVGEKIGSYGEKGEQKKEAPAAG
ncbi:hypothetical protein MASR2M79_19570 [Aminivibrio sp.]